METLIMKILKILILSLIANFAIANSDFYVGAGIGMANLSPDSESSDSSDAAYKLTLGAKINKEFALELGYASLGNSDGGIDYDYTSFGIVYNIETESGINPFIGAGIANFSSNKEIDEKTQGYGTLGVAFSLDEELDLDGRLSWTKYADDANVVLLEAVSGF
jgi:hypothetical protein